MVFWKHSFDMIKKWFIFIFFFFFFLIVIYSFYYFFFFLRAGGGGIGVASNFVICVYMLTLQFHPVLKSSEISPLHLTPHLKKSVIWEVIQKYLSTGPKMQC